MKTIAFKKIIPSILIVIILSVGIFGAFGVKTAAALIAPPSASKIPFLEWFKGEAYKAAINTTIVAATAMTYITGAILGVSGVLLNKAIDFTVRDFGGNIDNGVITEGWKMFRDLANIIIIFALLVIGIATILRIENYGVKKLLGTLIVVALLINFSMFFTKIVIDSSNLIATQFYNMAKTEGKDPKNWPSGKEWTGIANSYQQAFRFGTIYNIKTGEAFDLKGLKDLNLEWYQILIVGALASVLFLITAFAFFAASLLFVVRYVAFVFLIILSPLAFVGMILPATRTHSNRWWSALFNYSLFAPIFLLFTWFTIRFINSDAFQKGIGLIDKNGIDKNIEFSDITKSGLDAVESIPLFLNFVIAIGFILGSLILAKQMGGYGSSAIMSWGQSARKWGQGVIGRPFRAVGRGIKVRTGELSEKLQESKGGFAKTLRFIAPVGAMGAMDAAGRAIVKEREEQYKNMSTAALENKLKKKTTSMINRKAIARLLFDRKQGEPAEQAKLFINNFSENQQKEVYEGMSARNRIALEREIEKLNSGITKKLRGTLSKEELEKTMKSEKETEDKERENKIKEAIESNKIADINNQIQEAIINNKLHKLPKEVLMNEHVIRALASDDANYEKLTVSGPLSSDDRNYIYMKAVQMGALPPNFFNTWVGKKFWRGKK